MAKTSTKKTVAKKEEKRRVYTNTDIANAISKKTEGVGFTEAYKVLSNLGNVLGELLETGNIQISKCIVMKTSQIKPRTNFLSPLDGKNYEIPSKTRINVTVSDVMKKRLNV